MPSHPQPFTTSTCHTILHSLAHPYTQPHLASLTPPVATPSQLTHSSPALCHTPNHTCTTPKSSPHTTSITTTQHNTKTLFPLQLFLHPYPHLDIGHYLLPFTKLLIIMTILVDLGLNIGHPGMPHLFVTWQKKTYLTMPTSTLLTQQNVGSAWITHPCLVSLWYSSTLTVSHAELSLHLGPRFWVSCTCQLSAVHLIPAWWFSKNLTVSHADLVCSVLTRILPDLIMWLLYFSLTSTLKIYIHLNILIQ